MEEFKYRLSNVVYDGTPSITLHHRPFFSITVPCYNSAKTLSKLLDSIIEQELPEDIEVILCDDHSTESYQDIVDRYRDYICIRQVQTETNSGPGKAREVAASYAQGEWLTNIDHDDFFEPKSLKKVKQEIEKSKKNVEVVYTYYREINYNEDDVAISDKIEKKDTLLTHAKFFHIDQFWRKYDIHYMPGLKTHEDIYIANMVNCILNHCKGPKLLKLDFVTYNFTRHKNNITSQKYDHSMYHEQEYNFIEVHYGDWCQANYGFYPALVDKKIISTELMAENMLSLLIYDHFFVQGFMKNRETVFVKENLTLAKNHLKFVRMIIDMNVDQLAGHIAKHGKLQFFTIWNRVSTTLNDYEKPRLTFKQWLYYLEES